MKKTLKKYKQNVANVRKNYFRDKWTNACIACAKIENRCLSMYAKFSLIYTHNAFDHQYLGKKKIKKKFLLHKIMKCHKIMKSFNAVQKRKKNNKKSVYLFFARIFILYKAYFCAIKFSKKTNTILCVYIIYHQNECVGSNTEIYLFCLRSYTLYIIYVCCEC